MAQTSSSGRGVTSGLVRRPTLGGMVGKPAHLEGEQQILILWKKAIERFNSKLTNDEKKKLKIESQKQASFEELLASAREAKDVAERKKYRFTDTVQRILGVIDRYAAAGDIIIQQNVQYTCLAWGAFRFLLMFAVQEGNTAEKLTRTLYNIAQTVFRADEYAKLFASAVPSMDKILGTLSENLIYLYAEALNFLLRATLYFQKATMRRYFSAGFKPFDVAFKDILDNISLYERGVQNDVNLLRTQRENDREEYENGTWLLPADFVTNLQKLQDQHMSGTGEWFLDNDQVKSWIHLSSTGFLWIQGKPGSGKSTLAALLIRHLSSNSSAPIVNIFCNTGEEDKNNLLSVLRNIIFQLLEGSKGSQKALHKIIRGARLSSKTPNAQSMIHLWPILSGMLNCISEAFCVIDALDECNESSSEIFSFVDKLVSITKAAKAKIKIALISRLDRPGVDIDPPGVDIDPQHLWQFFPIKNSDVEDDIKHIISTRLRSSRVLGRQSPKIIDQLQRALIHGSKGMILWATLMLSELEIDPWNYLAVLEKLPAELSGLYQSILSRLVRQPRPTEIPRKLLFILGAARPLRFDELVFGDAMLGGASNDVHEYFKEWNLQDEARRLINQMSPLVMVMPDETVQLVHASLRDFLLGQDLQKIAKLEPILSQFSFDFRQLHEPIAAALVSYLSFECFLEDTKEDDQSVMQKRFPLMEYASKNFIWHLTRTQDVSERTTHVFVKFFTSTQGWRWHERLIGLYGLSRGHLQVLQSRLGEWIASIRGETGAEWKESCLDTFIMGLSKKRYEEAMESEEGGALALEAMDNLANAYFDQGRLKEEEGLRLRVLDGRKKVPGGDHPVTLTAMSNLANVYSGQGRLKEAEDLLLQVLDGRKKVLGDDHQDTLAVSNNLALTYSDQGRLKEAEDLQLQVLDGFKKILGDDHLKTLTAMNNLANTYFNGGHSKEAEDLQLQVLAGRKEVLEDNHPDTLDAMNNLAITYYDQGRLKEAEDLLMQVLAGRKKVLGDDHPNTLTAVRNLAVTYEKQGCLEEAEDLLVIVLAGFRDVLGDDHLDTLATMNNLAIAYTGQWRLKEAEDLLLQVLAGRKKVLGDDHPDTLTAVRNLAVTYEKQGRLEEAEDLLVIVLAGFRDVLGDDHLDTLATMNNLAIAYTGQGRLKEAEDLLLQVLAGRKKVLGDGHPDTLTAVRNLAVTYEKQGCLEEEVKTLREPASV